MTLKSNDRQSESVRVGKNKLNSSSLAQDSSNINSYASVYKEKKA